MNPRCQTCGALISDGNLCPACEAAKNVPVIREEETMSTKSKLDKAFEQYTRDARILGEDAGGASLSTRQNVIVLALRRVIELREKAKGQLDIIQRECEGEDEAFLANDYGGTGWEQEAPVTTVRKIRKDAEQLAEALETCLSLLENIRKDGYAGDYLPMLDIVLDGDGKDESLERTALSSYRERMGR